MEKKPYAFAVFLLILIIVILLFALIKPWNYFYPVVPVTGNDLLIFDYDVWNFLNYKYKENLEFFYCMMGESENGIFRVNELYEQPTTRASLWVGDINMVEPCPNGAIGTIHSHPYLWQYGGYMCEESKPDMYAFGANQLPINAVMCGVNTFLIWEFPEFRTIGWAVREK